MSKIQLIQDTHSETAGRNKALIKIGHLQAGDHFFIEWHRDVNPKNIEGSFMGLNVNDKSPNLIELTKAAIANGINVVSCDLPIADVLSALDEQYEDDAPHLEQAVISDMGITIRNEHAAAKITETLSKLPTEDYGALVMYGTNHFRMTDIYEQFNLQTLIPDLSGRECSFYWKAP